MACDEAVYAAAVLVFIEFLSRWYKSGDSDDLLLKDAAFDEFKNQIFIVFFLISMCSTLFYVKGLKNRSVPKIFEKYVPFLYLFDSVAAIGLGISLYHEHRNGVVLSMVLLTNFFLLHILHTLFSKQGGDLRTELTATLKSYIHHTASFFFLDAQFREVIVLTTIWRAVSMSGHSAQALHFNKTIDKDRLYRFNWVLSHVRNAVVGTILLLCALYPRYRAGFGRSAVGHVAYMLVRAGPVFRLGSVYVGDRPLWQGRTDGDRIAVLLRGDHPYMTAEVGSLTGLSCLFLLFKFLC